MAYHWFGWKLLPKTMLPYCQAEHEKHNYDIVSIQDLKTVIQENTLCEVIYNMSTIWLRPQYIGHE